MDFAVSNRPLDKFKADALILVLGKNGDLPETLPESTRDQLTRFIKAGDFDGSKGQMSWLHQPEGLAAARLLLVGRGDKQPSDQQWQGNGSQSPGQTRRLVARRKPAANSGMAGP